VAVVVRTLQCALTREKPVNNTQLKNSLCFAHSGAVPWAEAVATQVFRDAETIAAAKQSCFANAKDPVHSYRRSPLLLGCISPMYLRWTLKLDKNGSAYIENR